MQLAVVLPIVIAVDKLGKILLFECQFGQSLCLNLVRAIARLVIL